MKTKLLEKRFDLEQYVSRFGPKPYGDERAVTCPICEKKEKLWINVVKKTALCYYCDQGYGVLDLIMVLEDCNLFRAMEILVEGSRVEPTSKSLVKTIGDLFDSGFIEEEEAKPPITPLPKEFIAYKDRYPKVPKYFRERGIGQKRAERYNLGWCETGYFFNRLIVPITYRTKSYGFHPRWMKKTPPDDIKKVIYPQGMKSNLLLFNWDVARKQDRVVICEDPFSAMAVGKNATATFGTKLSSAQLRMLLQSDATEFTMLWDQDAIDKAYETAERFQTLGFTAAVAELPDSRDPDELSRDELETILGLARPTGLAATIRAKFQARRRLKPSRNRV